MKTTQKDFELFKKECKKFEKKFGLDEWHIDYYWEKFEPNNAVAKTQMDLLAKSASVTLNKEIGDKLQFNLLQVAKHEMIHCLLGELSELAWSRFVTRDEITSREEGLVRKLEKIISD